MIDHEKSSEIELATINEVLEEIGSGSNVRIVPARASEAIPKVEKHLFDTDLGTILPENSLIIADGVDELDGFIKVKDGFIRALNLENLIAYGFEDNEDIDLIARIETLKRLEWPLPLFHGTLRKFSSQVFYDEKFHIIDPVTFTPDLHYAAGYSGEAGSVLAFLMPAQHVMPINSLGGIKCYVTRELVDNENNISLDSQVEYENSTELRKYLESLHIFDYEVTTDGKSIVLPLLYGYLNFDVSGVPTDYIGINAKTGERLKSLPDISIDTIKPTVVSGTYRGEPLEFVIPNQNRVEIPTNTLKV